MEKPKELKVGAGTFRILSDGRADYYEQHGYWKLPAYFQFGLSNQGLIPYPKTGHQTMRAPQTLSK